MNTWLVFRVFDTVWDNWKLMSDLAVFVLSWHNFTLYFIHFFSHHNIYYTSFYILGYVLIEFHNVFVVTTVSHQNRYGNRLSWHIGLSSPSYRLHVDTVLICVVLSPAALISSRMTEEGFQLVEHIKDVLLLSLWVPISLLHATWTAVNKVKKPTILKVIVKACLCECCPISRIHCFSIWVQLMYTNIHFLITFIIRV